MNTDKKLSFCLTSSVFLEVEGARKVWKFWWVGGGLVLEESDDIESLN